MLCYTQFPNPLPYSVYTEVAVVPSFDLGDSQWRGFRCFGQFCSTLFFKGIF
nr:MAG TPA: hypothetical protein [Caudoviricetes sp.]